MSRQKFNVTAGLLLEYSVDHDKNPDALHSDDGLREANNIIRSEIEEAMAKIEMKLSNIKGVEAGISDIEFIDTEAGEEC